MTKRLTSTMARVLRDAVTGPRSDIYGGYVVYGNYRTLAALSLRGLARAYRPNRNTFYEYVLTAEGETAARMSVHYRQSAEPICSNLPTGENHDRPSPPDHRNTHRVHDR